MVATLTLVACGGAKVSTPVDGSVQTCQDDQDCSLGYTCTGGYCVAPTPIDGGPDVPVAPKMMVSPTLLDFGNAYVGGEFTKSFSIANVGDATLTVTAMNLVEDVTVGAFTVESSPPPFAIDPGANVTVTVVLRPNDNNLPTGKIIIHSDDPDPTSGTATVDLVSRAKGSPDLSVCSNNPAPPPDCQLSTDGNPIIDFGTVPYGSTVARLVDIRNIGDGNLPISITEVSLTNPNHFTLTLFELVDDGSGGYLERQMTLPFLLSAGDPAAVPPVAPTVIRAHVGFSAVGIDGDVPHIQLVIKYALPESPTSVPIVGTISGCVPVATDAGVPDGGADPRTDPNNCGTCGHKCTVAHGTPGCVNGQCTVAACDSGWDDCDGDPATGCERDLNNDPDACGGCGKACSGLNMLTRTCANGVCNGTCATGFKDCNGSKLTDGCESESATDPNNCSNCGVNCSSSHMATRTCSGGVCNGTCATGYADCDGNKQTNGCEVDLQNDPYHCGACTTNCTNPAPPNAATETCVGGACRVATCAANWYDQDGTFTNGCECQADAIPNSCGSATDLGTFAVGNSATYNQYNLTPSPSDSDWFKVTFTSNSTCNWHPKVAVSSTFQYIYLHVYTNCSAGTQACGDSGSSGVASLKTWEVTYSGCDPNFGGIDPDGNPYGNYSGTFVTIPQTVYVQVYATASTSTCLPYVLTISN